MLKDTLISYAIFAFYVGEKFLELLLNKLNYEYLVSKFFVVKKYPNESMQMKLFHVCWLLALFFEMNLHGKLLSGFASWTVAFVLLLAQILRWASILALGFFWSVDIYEMKEHPIVYSGPYAFFRHPIYLAVLAEFVLLPLILGCPYTLVVGTFINTLLLNRRIDLEERALEEQSVHS